MTRKTERITVSGINPMYHWYRQVPFWRSTRNFLVIYLCRFIPWPSLKSTLLRLLGMKVGSNVSFAVMTMVDIFFPELISVGDNSVIGYNTTILAHEFLVREWRKGPVVIGRDVLIGANSTVLPGVTIGDGAVIGAMSLVNRDVAAGAVVGGVPIRDLRA
ncbi:MAG: acyltransferase [Firmicutes bacterium]|nr:acyltransferase [Bacillota bacterium]MCL5040438.1 acyltransferase [Bacillota bacterium]